ncbi:MAG: hypothetical protein IPM34_09645 [Saprospiraceae bacterium]|nr:hypothetical protein [Saprospiraceae bacterium]
MVLISDSGSTKTDWACLSDATTQYFSTPGMNPVTQSPIKLQEIISLVKDNCDTAPAKLIHYGAGCRDLKARANLIHLYKESFRDCDVRVETDLLGAARSLCEGKPGLVCILGTGSNAAASDGHQLLRNFPSLGYILGDYGSASHLAKKLLQAYYTNSLPNEVAKSIQRQVPLLDDAFIYKFYTEPDQVSKLSQVASVVVKNKNEPAIQKLIQTAFFEFIDLQLLPLSSDKSFPVHFTGSIAFYLFDVLKSCLELRGFTPGNCIRKPIEGLVRYHHTYELN